LVALTVAVAAAPEQAVFVTATVEVRTGAWYTVPVAVEVHKLEFVAVTV
jgi:hypothetical protein